MSGLFGLFFEVGIFERTRIEALTVLNYPSLRWKGSLEKQGYVFVKLEGWRLRYNVALPGYIGWTPIDKYFKTRGRAVDELNYLLQPCGFYEIGHPELIWLEFEGFVKKDVVSELNGGKK